MGSMAARGGLTLAYARTAQQNGMRAGVGWGLGPSSLSYSSCLGVGLPGSRSAGCSSVQGKHQTHAACQLTLLPFSTKPARVGQAGQHIPSAAGTATWMGHKGGRPVAGIGNPPTQAQRIPWRPRPGPRAAKPSGPAPPTCVTLGAHARLRAPDAVRVPHIAGVAQLGLGQVIARVARRAGLVGAVLAVLGGADALQLMQAQVCKVSSAAQLNPRPPGASAHQQLSCSRPMTHASAHPLGYRAGQAARRAAGRRTLLLASFQPVWHLVHTLVFLGHCSWQGALAVATLVWYTPA